MLVGIFLVILPILTISEKWTGYRIPEANDRLGGFGSGFMGGLSGHQGALRAMFLTRRLPDKMAYAATASVLALCVDVSRIPVYLFFRTEEISEEMTLIVVLVISALIGVRVGKKWLQSIKIYSNTQHGNVRHNSSSGIFYIMEALN